MIKFRVENGDYSASMKTISLWLGNEARMSFTATSMTLLRRLPYHGGLLKIDEPAQHQNNQNNNLDNDVLRYL